MDKAHRPEPPTGDAPKQASVDTCGDDASEFEWEADAIFKEPEPRHDPDEVGKPLPSTYNEDVLLPRKWDSKCIESEFINLDNHEEFTKPVHETRYWESIQFDPAFVRDGLLPSGDALPKLPGAEDLEETSAIHREDPNGDEHVGGEPAILDRPKSHDGQPKRKRSHDSPPVNLRDQGRRNSPPRERRPPNRPRDRQTESYCPEPSRLDHCPRGNSARRESGSESRRRSPTSRRSSVSSASSSSSSLNSLDRELLGIEPKDKHGDGESKGRRGTERVPRPKRRRVQQLDSAYR